MTARRTRPSKRPRRGILPLVAGLALCLLAFPVSASAGEQAPPSFFGVSENGMTPMDFELLGRADAGVLRTILLFGSIKSEPDGPYHWGQFDDYVRETSSRGIEILPNLYGVPPWISEDRSAVPIGSRELRREWREFLIAAVERYGTDGEFWEGEPRETYLPVTTWQVWNEPNSITWWAPKPDPAAYAVLLNRSADAIRSADPAARVMTAGVVARPTNNHAIPGPEYLERLFAIPAAREATDVLAFHPFAPSVKGVRRQTVNSRLTLDQAGLDSVPIWITEIGWGNRGPGGHPLIKSDRGQIRTLRNTFEMALEKRERLGIERLLWYHWRDYRDDLCRWCESSGLINRKLGRKPLFNVFRQIATPPEVDLLEAEPPGVDPPVVDPSPDHYPYRSAASSQYSRSIDATIASMSN